jgi:hypothetical protein
MIMIKYSFNPRKVKEWYKQNEENTQNGISGYTCIASHRGGT